MTTVVSKKLSAMEEEEIAVLVAQGRRNDDQGRRNDDSDKTLKAWHSSMTEEEGWGGDAAISATRTGC